MPVFLLWFLRGEEGGRGGRVRRGKVRWGWEESGEERVGRLQVSNSVYISPVEATADCSVIHKGRQAHNHI